VRAMSISVNRATAEQRLREAWEQTTDVRVKLPAKIIELVQHVMRAPDVTYKYILVTGLLAKVAEPRVHPRALQAGSSLEEAYDARSLCHNVVVPFEKEHGNLFGLSNEPFLNKPARHPEHDKNNPQLRNKRLASYVHDVLEWAHRAGADEVFSALVHVLRLGRERAATKKQAAVAAEQNLERMIEFVREFLQETDGGVRLQAVWGALVELLDPEAKVIVHPPTQANAFAGVAGDVEVFAEGQLVSATECKHRALTAEDVRHGLKKATEPERRPLQYLFVCGAGIAQGQEKEVHEAVVEGSQLVDVALINIFEEIHPLARMLGPHRRAIFGQKVVELLERMHRPEAANEAAELWNRLEE